jgi:colanic acid/amylovoran biosynthesis glycosyltransferase
MSFAYLHESFPDPTKTFIYREVAAMVQLGMAPAIYSVRRPTAEEIARMEAIHFETRYLPDEAELRALIEDERGEFSLRQRRALSHWRAQKGDSTRVFEALWLGRELRRLGIRHMHAHFAGLAARTAWLIRELWGIGYSFTGHADDIFTPERKPISLAMLARDARFIATETDYSRERMEKEHPAARGKTHRIFNGIDLSTLDAPSSGAVARDPAAPPRIVSVGRLVEKKGFPQLIRACAELRGRKVPFVCDIVGGGPLEESLRQSVIDHGLDDRVILHGAQPQRFVQRVLKSARVFALAAQLEGDGGSDNLPTVIMEAMAAGLPVVSTRIAGIPEMVDDGKTGSLVSAADPRALADALTVYLRDETLAQARGAAGRTRAIEKFDVRVSARQLAELLTREAGVTAPAAAIAQCPALRGPATWWRRLLRR